MFATVSLDVRRQIAPISPLVWGNFIEHLGRCIYGGVYEPGSPLADARGFRTDVIEATRRLRPGIVRWPGGNFVSGYHWTDGIGPREARPRRMELAWHTVESNQFGTDDFVEWCRAVGTEPYICANMGSGTMDEAAAWVEYCNGTADSYWANKRRENGHPEPYGVKYWGLGNEVSGHWQIGAKSADDYVKAATEFAKVMRWVDPSISLVACGSCQQDAPSAEWNRKVVQALSRYCDYIGIHMYVDKGPGDFAEYMGTSAHVERYIASVRGAIDVATYHVPPGRRMAIAFDEWNVWHWSSPPEEQRYTLEDALVVGTFCNAFVRNADVVGMANLAQLVNILPAMNTSPEGMFLQAIFFSLELATIHNGSRALDVWVDCPEVAAGKHGKVPLLDVSASWAPETGTASVTLVNRHRDDPVEVAIETTHGRFAGEGTRFVIAGEDPLACNDFVAPDRVATAAQPLSANGATVAVTLPPHSLTMVKLPVRDHDGAAGR